MAPAGPPFPGEDSTDPFEDSASLQSDIDRMMETLEYSKLQERLASGADREAVLREIQAEVDEFNASEGELAGYNCPACRNRGYFLEMQENGRKTVLRCPCMKIRERQARSVHYLAQSGLQQMALLFTFPGWQVEQDWQQTALDVVLDYVEHPKGWLVMTGSPGIGKTHLCTAAAVSLIHKGWEARYMPWRQDATRLCGMLSGRVTGDYSREMDVLREVPLLYIDDLFKGRPGDPPTGGEARLAFDLINSRYNNSSLTIISMEYRIKDLIRMDEAMASRIAERSGGHRLEITGAQNYRLRNFR